MRVLEEIQHPAMKISILSWNEKYMIKIEAKNYEQVFKVKVSDVNGIEDVKKLINDDFLNMVAENFRKMHEGFVTAYNSIT
jgi:hypothetical protein